MSSLSADMTNEAVQPPASRLSSSAAAAAVSETPRRRILVFYVGGTIGMIKNAEGSFEPCAGYLTREMRAMRELRESNEVAPLDIIEYENLIDSSDMNASDYIRISNDIVTHYNDYNGFLIAQGTDTMHFTASALSFLLYNLGKPVIITGSMISLSEPLNDARRNLIIGVMLASNPSICEVCIFFNDSLLRGNRCVKTRHTYDAFETPNYPALGTMVGTKFVIHSQYLLSQPHGALRVMSDLRGRVMRFHLHTDADVQSLCCLLKLTAHKGAAASADTEGTRAHADAHATCTETSDVVHASEESNQMSRTSNNTRSRAAAPRGVLDGLILLVNGMGSVNSEQVRRLRQIHDSAAVHDVVVCVLSYTLRGEVISMEQTHQLERLKLNLIYLNDMTSYAAETKMMYLFGRGFSPDMVRAYMPRNLRGEVTPRLMCTL